MTELALTPEQLLAARRLLRWPRDRLAARMGITVRPIARFENEGVVIQAFDLSKAREVLEAAGVEFTEGDSPGVKLREAT